MTSRSSKATVQTFEDVPGTRRILTTGRGRRDEGSPAVTPVGIWAPAVIGPASADTLARIQPVERVMAATATP